MTPFVRIHDLCLHRYIQCGGCFVANQHLRLYSKGSGNRCALALSAADLMRIPPSKCGRQSATFQKPRCLRVCVMPGHPAVSKTFPNAVTQCAAWVKGICRCLENHLHFPIDHAE